MDSLNGTSTTNGTIEIAHDMDLEAPLLNLTPEGFVHGITAYISLAMLLGLPGNVLVVLVHRQIKSPSATDWLLFYQAVCDICSLVVCGSSFILMFTKLWNYFMPSSLCGFNFMILTTFFLASTFLITVTAVVRWSVMNTNREPMSPRISKLFGAFVIFVSIGCGSPSLILNKNTPSGLCYIDKQKTHLQSIVFGVYLLFILMSNAITCVCYMKIIPNIRSAARVAQTDLKNINNAFLRTRRATIKATISLALVFVVFFFSTVVPLTVITILNASNHNVGVAMNTVMFVLSNLFFTNTFASPLIYLLLNARFMHQVRGMCLRSRRNIVTQLQ